MCVRKVSIAVLVIMMVVIASIGIAVAEEPFPSKTITVINGYGPGGGTDTLSRMALIQARKILKVPMIVVNMPGAATVEATKYIQSQPADGYTIFVCTPTSIYNNPLSGRVSVMPEDWTPILRAHVDVSAINVRDDSPYKNWEELVAFAKENPGKIKWGIVGALSVDELASTAIIQKSGLDVKLVPFESGGESHAALLGGHVDVLFEEPGQVMQLIDAGKMRPLLILTDERIKRFPDVTCLGDMKYTGVPKLWRAFFVKAGTPEDRVKILEEALTTSMQSSVYKAYEQDSLLNLYPGGFLTSSQFKLAMKDDLESYRSVMKKLGYLK